MLLPPEAIKCRSCFLRFPCPGELFVFGEAGVLFWNLNLIFHWRIRKTGERKIKADQADATATRFETVAHFTPDLLCTGLKQIRNMFPLHILHLICMSHLHMIRIHYRVHHTFSKLYIYISSLFCGIFQEQSNMITRRLPPTPPWTPR